MVTPTTLELPVHAVSWRTILAYGGGWTLAVLSVAAVGGLVVRRRLWLLGLLAAVLAVPVVHAGLTFPQHGFAHFVLSHNLVALGLWGLINFAVCLLVATSALRRRPRLSAGLLCILVPSTLALVALLLAV